MYPDRTTSPQPGPRYPLARAAQVLPGQVTRLARWRRDRGLHLRMVVTVLLLAIVYAAFIAVLAYLGIGTLLLLVIVAVLLVGQYLLLGPPGPLRDGRPRGRRRRGAATLPDPDAPERDRRYDPPRARHRRLPRPQRVRCRAEPRALGHRRDQQPSPNAEPGWTSRPFSPTQLSHVKNRDVMVIALRQSPLLRRLRHLQELALHRRGRHERRQGGGTTGASGSSCPWSRPPSGARVTF